MWHLKDEVFFAFILSFFYVFPTSKKLPGKDTAESLNATKLLTQCFFFSEDKPQIKKATGLLWLSTLEEMFTETVTKCYRELEMRPHLRVADGNVNRRVEKNTNFIAQILH